MRFESPEGATPIDDADGLLIPGVISQADLSAAEAENILEARGRHLTRRPGLGRRWLTEPMIRRVHKDMFSRVWSWAGNYRNIGLNIGVAPSRIRDEIGNLCEDFWFWETQKENPLSVIERTVRLHHRLSWIHPFRNGNGRHARLMSDIHLFSHNHPLPRWPVEQIAKKGGAREDYLDTLRSADRHDYKPLVDLILRYTVS